MRNGHSSCTASLLGCMSLFLAYRAHARSWTALKTSRCHGLGHLAAHGGMPIQKAFWHSYGVGLVLLGVEDKASMQRLAGARSSESR